MSISGIFIRRPVMTTLTMLAILLFGVVSYRFLPVSDLPNVDFPTIQVSANLPGANPDTMASSVSTPLEKQFSTIAGIDTMTSSSSQGESRITLQFVLSRNIDAAAQDVQAAVARAVRKLPSNMPNPPSYRKVNPADQPFLFLTLTSPYMPLSDVDEFGENMLAQQISMVDGVAQVQVYGAQKYAVRIELDPYELASRSIGIDEVASAIGDYNVSMPMGSLSDPNKTVSVQANGQLRNAADFRPLIIKTFRNGQPVRLEDLGAVLDSVAETKSAAWDVNAATGMKPAIILAVQRQPGTNTVEVADAVKRLIPTFQAQLPKSVTLNVLRDSSVSIRTSAHDVQFTLLLTLVLVVLVIFLFLRNLSATMIPSVTLPMAIAGTFIVMSVLGYSLDNLSLMALTLSAGFVVDDAIVMLENIVRHKEMGKDSLQAAYDGSRQVGFTIVSMTLSLAAVFIPVLFMGGIVGRLFREFSVTIGVAVLVSGFVSLTLTPMLASRFLREERGARHNWAYQVTEAAFQWCLRFYGWTLRVVLRRRRMTMVFSALILIATGWLFWYIPKGFIPSEDRAQISVNVEMPQDASFDATQRAQKVLSGILMKDPNIDHFMARCDANSSGMFLVLKPVKERQRMADGRFPTADDVIAQLRPMLNAVIGVRVSLTNPPAINIGGRMSRSLYQFTLQGANTDALYDFGSKLEKRVTSAREFFQDVSSDLQLKNPQLNVQIDRDEAKIRDVTPQLIEDALSNAYGTQQVSTILTPSNDYEVIMELAPQYQRNAAVLSMLYVRSKSGQLVPLNAITTMYEDAGPLSINHSGQRPSVTISFNIAPGVSLSQAVDKLNELARTDMPSGITSSFQGTAQAFQSSLKSMGWLLVLAIAVIYMVLGILYESFFHPITILSALPFAGFGALATLLIFGSDLSLYAFVGIIMLVGLVKKNGIMMVDFAIQSQQEGKDATEAIHEACMIRFRPIMMTTMAALMAGLPIALGYGAGGEARRPLGLAVVGGLVFSQTLTLYVTPVFYIYIDRLRARFASARHKAHPEDGHIAPGQG